MDIPFSRWYSAIPHRVARRSFDYAELTSDSLAQIQTICQEFRPFSHVRAELSIKSPEKVFKGFPFGSIMKVTGAPAFIALIGDKEDPNVNEKVGYLGEGIILEATAIGLATCWVGGFFHRDIAEAFIGAGEDERVFAVTPIGHALEKFSFKEKIMKGFSKGPKRKPIAEIVSGLEQVDWPNWMQTALEAARLAPSANNMQPWRFYLEPKSITISVNKPEALFGMFKRIDCGIALLHIEVAVLECGIKGQWQWLESPRVAKFAITDD